MSEVEKDHDEKDNDDKKDEAPAKNADVPQGHLIGTKIDGWQVKKVIGNGANGVVFLVEKQTKNKKNTTGVMKIPLRELDSLIWEQNVMLKTQEATNVEIRNFHLVRILEHGKAEVMLVMPKTDKMQKVQANYVVMECTPDNPVKYIHSNGDALTNVGRNGAEMLKALYDLHHCGFLHRDLKPENMGCDKKNHLVLYDLGMARRFMDKRGKIRNPRSYCGFRGTSEWATLWAEDGRDQGQVDDLIAWLYILNEWTNAWCSDCPQAWSWLGDDKDDPDGKNPPIRQYCKLGIFPARLTLDNCPQALYRIKLYLHTLGRNDAPDYFYLSLLVHELQKTVKRKSKPEPLNMARAKMDLQLLNLTLL